MATSSDHLAASIDPFLRYSFSDYLYPDSKSIFTNDDFNFLLQSQPVQEDHLQYQNQNLNQSLSPYSLSNLEQQQFQQKQTTTTNPTPSISDPETFSIPKRRTTTTSLNSKPRITKRKSRATKKNQTTFITADPANFRQMVQQVTGIRFENNSSTSSSPYPSSLTNLLRPVGRLYNACLPTLDTSSFLLDQSQSLIGDRLGYGVGGGLGSVGVGAQTANGESGGYGGGASDGFVSYPTLESWKVK